MTELTFIDAEGARHTIVAEDGLSLMEVAKVNDIIGIEADCGGACACATCHVFFDEDSWNKVGAPGEEEGEMLEFSAHRTPRSRLSCQVTVSPALAGITVEIPESQH